MGIVVVSSKTKQIFLKKKVKTATKKAINGEEITQQQSNNMTKEKTCTRRSFGKALKKKSVISRTNMNTEMAQKQMQQKTEKEKEEYN